MIKDTYHLPPLLNEDEFHELAARIEDLPQKLRRTDCVAMAVDIWPLYTSRKPVYAVI